MNTIERTELIIKLYFHCTYLVYFRAHGDMQLNPNLVPRSHSVTGNVRFGKVRQYTIFHWLLKKGCSNAIYAPIGLFRGALSEGLGRLPFARKIRLEWNARNGTGFSRCGVSPSPRLSRLEENYSKLK